MNKISFPYSDRYGVPRGTVTVPIHLEAQARAIVAKLNSPTADAQLTDGSAALNALFVIQADVDGLNVSSPGKGCKPCNDARWDCVAPHGLACCWCVANRTDCDGRPVSPGTSWAESPLGRDARHFADDANDRSATNATPASTPRTSVDTNVEDLYDQCVKRVMAQMRTNTATHTGQLASSLEAILPSLVDQAVDTVRTKHAAGLTAVGLDADNILLARTILMRGWAPSMLGPLRVDFGATIASRIQAFSTGLYDDTPTRAKYYAKLRANPNAIDLVAEEMATAINTAFAAARPS